MQPLHLALSVVLLLAELAVLVRVVLRPHREPISRLAWVVVIIIAPILGMALYLVLGEARLGRARRGRDRLIDGLLPRPPLDAAAVKAVADGYYGAPFALAQAVNRLGPTVGNAASLLADNNGSINAIIADIDVARASVHLCFYIWLTFQVSDVQISSARIRRLATVHALLAFIFNIGVVALTVNVVASATT